MSLPSTFAASGMNGQESIVMRLWDEGLSIEAITDRLNIRRERVQKVLHMFALNATEDRWEHAARAATAELGQRLAEMGRAA